MDTRVWHRGGCRGGRGGGGGGRVGAGTQHVAALTTHKEALIISSPSAACILGGWNQYKTSHTLQAMKASSPLRGSYLGTHSGESKNAASPSPSKPRRVADAAHSIIKNEQPSCCERACGCCLQHCHGHPASLRNRGLAGLLQGNGPLARQHRLGHWHRPLSGWVDWRHLRCQQRPCVQSVRCHQLLGGFLRMCACPPFSIIMMFIA